MSIEEIREDARVCARCGGLVSKDVLSGLCTWCVAGALLESDGAEAEPREPEATGTAPQVVGDYELIELLARGGMGLVYKARQRSLNRLVAVKMIAGGALADPAARQRLRQEGTAAAVLRHPNIVAIHEIGEHLGQPFFSMELVAGPTLAEAARHEPMEVTRAAQIAQSVAEATEHAHQHGILHRDLKPSNVLLDASGAPRVTDFGSARHLDSQQELTLTGQVIGSPNYLSPEQAKGHRSAIGVESDVYGLGAILYFLLTARPPFVGGTVESTLAQVQGAEPVAPRLLNGTVPRDLETIVLKCLQKEPAHRYRSARLLAEELGRFLRNEPILARPTSQTYRLWRWGRRNPLMAGLTGTTLLLLLTLSVGAPLAAWKIDRERRNAEASARSAERLAATERQNLYAADMLLVQQALDTGNLSHSLSLLERHRPLPNARPDADSRGWEWRYYWQQTRSAELLTLGSADHSVLSLAYAPDGNRLASGSQSGEVLLWDMNRRTVLERHRHTARVDALRFSSEHPWLVTGGMDGTIRLLGVPGFATQRTFPFPDGCRAVGFVPDTNQLLAVGESEWARFSLDTGKLLQRGEAKTFARAAISPDGKWLACPQASGEVWLLNTQTGARTHRFSGHTGFVLSVAFSHDNRWLASGGFDGLAQVYELRTGKVVAQLASHHGVVSALGFSVDGGTLATASYDGTVKLWQTSTWEERATLRGHLHPVWALALSPDGDHVATGDKLGIIKVWSTRTPPNPSLPAQVDIARYSRDGSTALTGTAGGEWTVWDMRLKPVARPLHVAGQDRFQMVHPSDRGFVIQTLGGEFLSWTPKASAATPLKGGTATPWKGKEPTFFGGNRFAALRESDNHLRLVDWLSGQTIELEPSTARDAFRIAVPSRNGTQLLLAGEKHELALYEVASGRLLASRPPARFAITTADFAADGTWLAIGSEDGVVRILDAPRLQLRAELRSGADAYWSITIAPDGRRVAAGTAQGTVAMWDVESGREVARLRARLPGMVLDLIFGDEGDTLISANTLTVWRAATWDEIESTRNETLRR